MPAGPKRFCGGDGASRAAGERDDGRQPGNGYGAWGRLHASAGWQQGWPGQTR
jgi:hypothetical protein